LDLFSGIGGLTLALKEWVTPIAYCESDEYAQKVLLKQMVSGNLPVAPIWDDVRTLRELPCPIDIIYGGFPCQDISVAGKRLGLEGERSGLFFEVVRLVKAFKPTFLFLENVPNIRTKGLDRVLQELTSAGYDCRWCMLSAKEIGANHKRNRWWLLGYSKYYGLDALKEHGSLKETIQYYKEGENETFKSQRTSTPPVLAQEPNASNARCKSKRANKILRPKTQKLHIQDIAELCSDVSNPLCKRLEGQWSEQGRITEEHKDFMHPCWWTVEPDVGRVANGVPSRVDRIRALGNAVVPLQARTAFMELMGIKG
jgi:DNA (cytosine-5)-methyltransferase 1